MLSRICRCSSVRVKSMAASVLLGRLWTFGPVVAIKPALRGDGVRARPRSDPRKPAIHDLHSYRQQSRGWPAFAGHDGVDGPLTASTCQSWVHQRTNQREPSMTEIIRVGIDLAKNVFEVHAVNAADQVVVRRSLRRNQVLTCFSRLPACLIGMEACGTANYWARELIALGHTVRLIPPAYAKPYVRRNKNDAADAAAICEAVGRPSMRFVPVKTVQQQSEALTHKARELLMKQHTMAMNALRSLMAEFGIVVPQGPQHIAKLRLILANPEDDRIPDLARAALNTLADTLAAVDSQIETLDKAIKAQVRANATARRLETIPGFGPILSGAIA